MRFSTLQESTCILCGRKSTLIAECLGLCLSCIRRDPQRAIEHSTGVHADVREKFGQVPKVPEDGVLCPFCARACRIPEGGRGFCGLRTAHDGHLKHLAGDQTRGLVHWYRDGLPTNCVADFVCPGHDKHGYHNLAVFYSACTLNCLFCQNWTFRRMSPEKDDLMTARELADVANDRSFCICYFGGDPSAQMPHALVTSRILAERGLKVCFETNGLGNPRLIRSAARLAKRTGGTIKFDLKAFDPNLHKVLTSADNQRVKDNFQSMAEILVEKDKPPQLVAATLLVPGYIDAQEVSRIAGFISGVDPRIPYSLLAFAPQFMMTDLPATSRAHAQVAQKAAGEAGLLNVRVGNLHLLSEDYGEGAGTES